MIIIIIYKIGRQFERAVGSEWLYIEFDYLTRLFYNRSNPFGPI